MAWIIENWFHLMVLGSLWALAATVDGVRRVLVEIHIDQAALRERYAPRVTHPDAELEFGPPRTPVGPRGPAPHSG